MPGYATTTPDHWSEREARAAATAVAPVLPGRLRPGPVEPRVLRQAGARLGGDLGDVTIHDDAAGHAAAAALGARAFTIGGDVWLGAGTRPGTEAGRLLVAHELAHVAQQRSGRVRGLVQRAETDTGVPGVCAALADGSAALNAEVNARLAAARVATTGRPLANFLVEAFNRLGQDTGVGFLARIESWANGNLPHAGGGMTVPFVRDPTAGTKYQHLSGSAALLFNYLAPVVKLGAVCCGTDKIGHFFQQGFQYFTIAAAPMTHSTGVRIGEGLGTDVATAWGEWTEGVVSRAHRRDAALMTRLRGWAAAPADRWGIRGVAQGHFGLGSTGVHSNADLAANAAGMRFWQDLAGNRAGYTFDVARYVSPQWDEEVAGNQYSATIGAAVRAAGRLNPADRIVRSPGFPTP